MSEQATQTPDQILEGWEKAKLALEQAKELEMNLRLAYVKAASDPNKTTGTENIELANGYKAKIVKGIRYNVNQATINRDLDAIENISAEGKLIAERVIKWKAELSKTEYDQMPQHMKLILDHSITTSDATPTLEIVAPKTKATR